MGPTLQETANRERIRTFLNAIDVLPGQRGVPPALSTVLDSVPTGGTVGLLLGSVISMPGPANVPGVKAFKMGILDAVRAQLGDGVSLGEAARVAADMADNGTATGKKFKAMPFETFMGITRAAFPEATEHLLADTMHVRAPNHNHTAVIRFARRMAEQGRDTVVVTTNYDTGLEAAMATLGLPAADIHRRGDFVVQVTVPLAGPVLTLWKVHGCISAPGSLVNAFDAVSACREEPAVQRAFAALGEAAVLLVCGYGANDLDLRPLISDLRADRADHIVGKGPRLFWECGDVEAHIVEPVGGNEFLEDFWRAVLPEAIIVSDLFDDPNVLCQLANWPHDVDAPAVSETPTAGGSDADQCQDSATQPHDIGAYYHGVGRPAAQLWVADLADSCELPEDNMADELPMTPVGVVIKLGLYGHSSAYEKALSMPGLAPLRLPAGLMAYAYADLSCLAGLRSGGILGKAVQCAWLQGLALLWGVAALVARLAMPAASGRYAAQLRPRCLGPWGWHFALHSYLKAVQKLACRLSRQRLPLLQRSCRPFLSIIGWAYRRLLRAARNGGDLYFEATVQMMLLHVDCFRDTHFAPDMNRVRDIRRVYKQLERANGLANVDLCLGRMACLAGDPDVARQAFHRGRDLSVGRDPANVRKCVGNLVRLACGGQGDNPPTELHRLAEIVADSAGEDGAPTRLCAVGPEDDTPATVEARATPPDEGVAEIKGWLRELLAHSEGSTAAERREKFLAVVASLAQRVPVSRYPLWDETGG